MHFHAVVWIDHRATHVLGFGQDEPSRNTIKSGAPEHIHHKAGSIGSGHVHDAPAYFDAIAAHLSGFHEILIVGPAEARTEFQAYLARYKPDIAKRVLAVEPMDHASEGEIIDHARHFFARADRMTPQR
jgi:hypothetical protein